MDIKLWEQRIWIEKMGRSKKKEKTKPKGKKKGSISDQIENRYRETLVASEALAFKREIVNIDNIQNKIKSEKMKI